MGTVHIIPEADLVAHDISDACVCVPALEFVPAETDDDEDGWLYTHSSLDARELGATSGRWGVFHDEVSA